MFLNNIKKIFIICTFLLFVSSCGWIPSGYMGHSTNTQVVLSEANYKIITTVKGEATAHFIMGIGPFNNRLYSRAKKDMLKNANLAGGGNKSRALINIVTDTQYRYIYFYFPFWFSKTIYVSADVIEFKEK